MENQFLVNAFFLAGGMLSASLTSYPFVKTIAHHTAPGKQFSEQLPRIERGMIYLTLASVALTGLLTLDGKMGHFDHFVAGNALVNLAIAATTSHFYFKHKS